MAVLRVLPSFIFSGCQFKSHSAHLANIRRLQSSIFCCIDGLLTVDRSTTTATVYLGTARSSTTVVRGGIKSRRSQLFDKTNSVFREDFPYIPTGHRTIQDEIHFKMIRSSMWLNGFRQLCRSPCKTGRAIVLPRIRRSRNFATVFDAQQEVRVTPACPLSRLKAHERPSL